MEDEAEVIKHQMEETRTALSEKLEKLEDKVVSTVQQTTGAVTETVESVKEAVQGTVGTLKETVQDTVDSVKEKVQDTVESVKETFDLRRHVEEHPWAMVGGSVAVGFLLGRLVPMPSLPRWPSELGHGNGKHRARFSFTEGDMPSTESALPPPSSGEAPGGGTMSPLLHTLGEALAPAIDSLKGLAIGTATGVLGELVMNAVPESMKEEVRRTVDDITTRLGGKKLWEPGESGLFEPAGASPERTGDGQHRWS